MKAYLCVVTGLEGRDRFLSTGLVADNLEDGEKEFKFVCEQLRDYIGHVGAAGVTAIRLVEFERVKVMKEYGT